MKDFILFCKFHDIPWFKVDGTRKLYFGDMNQTEIEQIFEWKRRNGNVGMIFHNEKMGLIYTFFAD